MPQHPVAIRRLATGTPRPRAARRVALERGDFDASAAGYQPLCHMLLLA
jgi:hypothetical protein